mmetsp:Transcript_34576/g.79943  ORF Transcript_34576/g.79943 Transcript_34576/m.79943 type:complete len:495 (-) Transcript_34576:158-1642(-)|eukprot:CAMPEP_0113321644 /NCGR_PEP_ID=MMETSP0010_2-20120614/15058_1 /TAXON_ID=216773 ORGANISM="Corethron hystrix, Strain 308" /NCGR_SAMPLE_ID=MMETSP0010_2 /ASSEMBLY_ACC=CAM_ASM_000155 /LENGTH=494 /DNA_ID=CAMNT_0000179843 /DNA_START=20 /DNA_END=1504 /DNA_ORIENTATION=- /assembly_acc=CAM_ASM_000155
MRTMYAAGFSTVLSCARSLVCSFAPPKALARRPAFVSNLPPSRLPRASASRSLCASTDDVEELPRAPLSYSYSSWTVSDDRALYERRLGGASVPELAAGLGRGLRSIETRLRALEDVESAAYCRLFCVPGAKGVEEGDAMRERLTPVSKVLRRVRWDDSLRLSDFSVAYYDRVSDAVERTSADAPNLNVAGREKYFVWAIPEHRIESVWYRERRVWDKATRQDDVFGTGRRVMGESRMVLAEVLATYDEWSAEQEAQRRSEKERLRDVLARVEVTLGGERFGQLRAISKGLVGGDADKIRDYVRTSMRVFEEARWEAVAAEGGDATSTARVGTPDPATLDLLSELISTLPDAVARETAMHAISALIKKVEGRRVELPVPSPSADLREEDLEEKFVRGSGAGGQKINKTSNRVVLAHLPTGLRVECQDTRSLQQNRKIARKRLQVKLEELVHGDRAKSNVKRARAAERKAKNKIKRKSRRKKKLEAEETAGKEDI